MRIRRNWRNNYFDLIRKAEGMPDFSRVELDSGVSARRDTKEKGKILTSHLH